MKRYKHRKQFTYNGKRYSVYADTMLEFGQKYAEKLRELEEGTKVIAGNVSLNYWAEKCIKTYKTGQKPVTREKYMNRVRYCIL